MARRPSPRPRSAREASPNTHPLEAPPLPPAWRARPREPVSRPGPLPCAQLGRRRIRAIPAPRAATHPPARLRSARPGGNSMPGAGMRTSRRSLFFNRDDERGTHEHDACCRAGRNPDAVAAVVDPRCSPRPGHWLHRPPSRDGRVTRSVGPEPDRAGRSAPRIPESSAAPVRLIRALDESR